MGCYSLLASRHIDNENDCINIQTGEPGGMTFGYSPCICSSWGQTYFSNLEKFIQETGMDCLEHDGSYPGDFCASENHPGHRNFNDSQWNQFYTIANFYHRMCESGVYLNVPDFYFLNGSTKTSIGYKEVNWSLPREMQLLHTRQLNYDCTFERPQSACWSFVSHAISRRRRSSHYRALERAPIGIQNPDVPKLCRRRTSLLPRTAPL